MNEETMTCPACGVDVSQGEDVTPNARPRRAQNGDLAICTHCTAVAIVVDGVLLAITPEQLSRLKPDIVAVVRDQQARFRRSVN